MRLRNLFYLLLALPLFFASCSDEPTQEPSNKPSGDSTSGYYMDKVLGEGVRHSSSGLDLTDNYIYMAFSSKANDVILGVMLVGEPTDTILTAGTYTNAEGTALADSCEIFYMDTYEKMSFEGGDATVVVSGDINGYQLDILLTDAEQREYHFAFDGVIKDMEPVPAGDDDVIVATYASAVYYGDAYTPGTADNYYLILSDLDADTNGGVTPGATYFYLDIYAPITEDMTITPGTYNIDTNSTAEPFTIDSNYSYYFTVNEEGGVDTTEDYTESGFVTFYDDGSIYAEITMQTGSIRKVSFNGTIEIIDGREDLGGGGSEDSYSTLTGDLNCDLTYHAIYATNYGDFYEIGYDNWVVMINPNNGVGDFIILDLVTNKADTDNFLGNYTISDSIGNNTAAAGYVNAGAMLGCWYYQSEDAENISGNAPMIDGGISITGNDDGTITVEFNVWDDESYNITGSWTGTWAPMGEALSAAKKATQSLVIAENNALTYKKSLRVK